jgi:hypothetical protein
MRYWGKLKTEDRIIRDLVHEDSDFTAALVALCGGFDISRPIVCEKHIKELRMFRRTIFYPDDFVEGVGFDTLEIEIFDNKKSKPL